LPKKLFVKLYSGISKSDPHGVEIIGISRMKLDAKAAG